MSELKVALDFEGKMDYFRIQRNLSLAENINAICTNYNLTSPENFALRFWNNPNSPDSVFITENNFLCIKNGDILKVTDSLEIVTKRVFKNIESDYLKEHGFKELFNLSSDDGFVKYLVENNKHLEVLQMIQFQDLQPTHMTACLSVIFALLKNNYLKEIETDIVVKVINFLKSDETDLNDIQYILIVLCQILYLKKKNFERAKEMISNELKIDDIFPYVSTDSLPNLQLNALMFINALTKYSKDEKRRQIVKELNKNQNKDSIFTGIIKNKFVSRSMAHELYVYQTYMLSIYNELLADRATKQELLEISVENFNNSHQRVSKNLQDLQGKSISTMSLNSLQSIDRSSFGSILDEHNIDQYSGETDKNQLSAVCRFTYKALSYYKKYNSKNFYHSEREEKGCGQGLISTADKVVGIIVKILDIACEPNRTSEFYNPLLFNASLRLPFVYELFSRAMLMVSRTRKEMKGYSPEDYEKIFMVVEKEIRLILERKPTNYKELTSLMRSVNYQVVSEQWQKEKDLQWKNLLDNHQSVLEIKRKIEKENKRHIFEQRIKIIQKGGIFPKVPEKKNKNKYFFIRLSENRKNILWGDWNDLEQIEGQPNSFPVNDIKYFITGKACPHVKDNSVKDSDRAFSIIFGDDNISLNCFAENKSMCNIWADAFYLLLGKENRSEDYKKELKVLVDMECTLKLLELQEVPIPFEPPAIPPLPESLPV